MTRFIARRLLILPLLLILVNFLGFTYAFYARPLRAERTPYVAVEDPGELIPSYIAYLAMVFDFDFSMELAVPGSLRANTPNTFGEIIRNATIASLGLLTVTLTLSSIIGFFIGQRAVKNESNQVAHWLSAVTTVGLAMPSFYVGSILIFITVAYILWRGPGTDSPLPLDGFGWDLHMVLPVLALMARPTVQLAQVTANFISGELGKQYVIAARSLGYTWRSIRSQYALKNILAPVVLTIAGLSRLILGEQILIEWLFRWPGLGRLLAWTLVPAQLTSSEGSPLFLNPPVMATVITIIAAIFLLVDLIASILVRVIDPRLRNPETEVIDRK
jgi:peptide/nickel transport system permease protein